MSSIKAMKTEDFYLAKLPRGVWVIDGDKVEIDDYEKEIQFKDPIITRVRRIEQTVKYVDAQDNELTPDQYYANKKELEAKGWQDDDNYHPMFKNIDDKHAYEKFVHIWTPIKRTIETEDDPLNLEITSKEVLIDTGNPFIKPVFSISKMDSYLYELDRKKAIWHILKTTFSSLGMEYKSGKVDYQETNEQKIWGNPDHGGFRYVVAFNRYILNDYWGRVGIQRGNLADLTASYEEDKKSLESIIKTGYAKHFMRGQIDFDASTALETLELISEAVGGIHSKVKTQGDKRRASKLINEFKSNLKKNIEAKL